MTTTVDASVASFQRDGFLVCRGLVSERELDLLREASAAVIADGLAGRGEHHLFRPRSGGGEVYWRSERMWQRHPVFRATAMHPGILDVVGRCIREPFFPFNDSLVVKVPQDGAAVEFHQDPPFGPMVGDPDPGDYPWPTFTTDIYLDESTVGNGCLWVLPGRHREGRVALDATGEDALFDQAIPVEVEPGDVLLHFLSTPHGSRANAAAALRRTYYIAYMTRRTRTDLYGRAAWTSEKPNGDAATHELMEAMIRARTDLGLGSPLAEGFVLEGGTISLPDAREDAGGGSR